VDNIINSVEKGVSRVNNVMSDGLRLEFSTEKGLLIHHLFTTYTNVIQDTFY